MPEETIVAVATPAGRGGIGVVRLSGVLAYSIALTITKRQQVIPRRAVFVHFYHLSQLIDTGLVIFFKAPHSFTGEDVVEFQAHGSPIVLDTLVKACVQLGARIAQPGEFSQRAFLNDKIDLAQAEAIADLINASSLTAARLALRSLQGEFSQQINLLTEQLINLRLYVEAALDFPEEEIDFLNDGKILNLLNNIISDLNHIRQQANQGSLLREGLLIVIAGKPNVGKSTLINYLAGREVAIVTDIAGTTRDIMKEAILIDDLPIHLIDTAGLRATDDRVEKEGVKRAWQQICQADCVLLVGDVDNGIPADLQQELTEKLDPHIPIIKIINKIDLHHLSPKIDNLTVYIAAKNGLGINFLKEKIKTMVGYQPHEGNFLARRRHLQALDECKNWLLTGQEQLTQHQAGELLAEDLRKAHHALGEITGEFKADDLLGRIFSTFCIGK